MNVYSVGYCTLDFGVPEQVRYFYYASRRHENIGPLRWLHLALKLNQTMNTRIKTTILIIGSITILAAIYAFFNDKVSEALFGAFIGLSLIVTAFSQKKDTDQTKGKD